jgi:hypothetical protein
MQMNHSTRAEVSQTDLGKDHRLDQLVDNATQELCSNERPRPLKQLERSVPDERAMETFADGAGI